MPARSPSCREMDRHSSKRASASTKWRSSLATLARLESPRTTATESPSSLQRTRLSSRRAREPERSPCCCAPTARAFNPTAMPLRSSSSRLLLRASSKKARAIAGSPASEERPRSHPGVRRRSREVQELSQPCAPLGQVLALFPELKQRAAQAKAPVRFPMLDQPIESRPEVVVLDLELGEPFRSVLDRPP